jgi:tRNA pseudouridine55 synthase
MTRKKPRNTISGWIILEKPSGITSAHAVGKVKRLLHPEKIGHAGTLDPLASGVLPLALGEATKTVPYMMDAAKTYGFTVTWGQQRDTDDSQGQVTATSDARPSEADIRAILPRFTGKIQQTPPNYSAIKVDGKRAYDMARSGEIVELKSRETIIHSLEIQQYSPEQTAFICHCSKGTYVRSLARDMGKTLGSLGYISVLRRLKVGNFSENDAISLELLEEMVHKNPPDSQESGFLRPVESALDDILAQDIDSDQAVLLKRGQCVALAHCTQIGHQPQRVGVGDCLRNRIGNRQRKARALQQAAQIADFAHRQHTGRKAAGQRRFRFGQTGPQFRQGLPAEQHPQKQPVRAQRTAALHKLADRIIRPVQAQGMDHQIMRARCQIKHVSIANNCRLRLPRLPHRCKGGDNGGSRKPSVNLDESFLNLVGGIFLQKQGRAA